jgi:hypothetical protein
MVLTVNAHYSVHNLKEIRITDNIKNINMQDFTHFELFWRSHINDLNFKTKINYKNYEYAIAS